MSIETDHVMDLARELAVAKGAYAFLKKTSETIRDGLVMRTTFPEIEVARDGQRVRFRPRVQQTPPGIRRDIDKAVLRRDFPDAYAAAALVKSPKFPYSVRMEGWKTLKAKGQEEARNEWHAVTHQMNWNYVGTRTAVLFDLRQDLHVREEAMEEQCSAIREFIAQHNLPLIIPADATSRIVLRRTQPSVSIDYDTLEQQYPNAARLIIRTPSPASTPTIRYDKVD